MEENPWIELFVPGRICLLGEHTEPGQVEHEARGVHTGHHQQNSSGRSPGEKEREPECHGEGKREVVRVPGGDEPEAVGVPYHGQLQQPVCPAATARP